MMKKEFDGRGVICAYQILSSLLLLFNLWQPCLPYCEDEGSHAIQNKNFRGYGIGGEIHHGIIPVKD
ncbi:MAG: hypothetical protein PHE09_07100 [Oscillospiraceae bacterium]|nr:hypothetical protein [Oscillospiraceae bacterium]